MVPLIEHSADVTLMQAISLCDETAIAELYARFYREAFGSAYVVLHDGKGAEDVAQESFIKLWQIAHTYDAHRAGLRGWLAVIVQRRAIDQLRRRRARREASLEEAAEIEAPIPLSDLAEQAETAVAIHAAIATLPPEQREALGLAWFDGLSHPEVAVQLGLPLGTVKTRIRLGMRKMRAQLETSTAASHSAASAAIE